MIRDEMVERMTWHEFQTWCVLANIDAKAQGQGGLPVGTPQQQSEDEIWNALCE